MTQKMDFFRKEFFLVSFLLLSSLGSVDPANDIYHNQFAVHIPAGRETADTVAAKHGFVNLGQIGSLENHFLFEHPRISKRSTDLCSEHHDNFAGESDIVWFEQQKELTRKKRDVSSEFEMPGKIKGFELPCCKYKAKI